VDKGLEDDIQEARLAKVEKATTALALNRFSIFERGGILFVRRPSVIGFTTLLRNFCISVASWTKILGCWYLEILSQPLQLLKPPQRRGLRMLYSR